MIKEYEYVVCASCEETFLLTQEDRERSMKKAQERFPDEMENYEPMVRICGDCNAKIWVWVQTLTKEERDEMREDWKSRHKDGDFSV